MAKSKFQEAILPGLPVDLIWERLKDAPGSEIESGKFFSPESSAALVANGFGFFLNTPTALPPLPIGDDLEWRPSSVNLEEQVRFPWTGGRHPWLDVLIELPDAIIGVESKRYEPFRSKVEPKFSEAYWRSVWGDDMGRYCRMRDDLRSGAIRFERLDGAQLVKHAFGLRTAANKKGKIPVLVYLFAEPASWPDDRPVPPEDIAAHRREVDRFAERVAGDEVRFVGLSWRALLDSWKQAGDAKIRDHALAVEDVFAP